MKKILFILAVFALGECGLEALTLSQVRSEIRRTVRDTSSTPEDQRYSDEVLLSYINEAQREIVNLSMLSEKATTYVLTPRTTYYALPNDVITVTQVKFRGIRDTQTLELNEVSRENLRQKSPNWESVNGTPVDYYVSQSTGSSASSTSTLLISYIPIPTTNSTGTVTVWYYNQVDDLVSDSDVPFNGKRNVYPYHMALVYYVTYRLKAIEGRADEAEFYLGLFNNQVAMMVANLGKLPNYRPSVNVPNR